MANTKVRVSVCLFLPIAIGFLLWVQSCGSTKPTRPTDKTQDAPQKTDPLKSESPKGEVASYKVQIEVREGKCVFKYDGPFQGQIGTEVLAPCEFVRDHTDKIRYYEYKNRKRKGGGYFSVILLIGGPVAAGGHSDKFMKDGCGTEAQAISLSPRGVAIGDIARGLVVICPTSDVEEVMFGSMARQN